MVSWAEDIDILSADNTIEEVGDQIRDKLEFLLGPPSPTFSLYNEVWFSNFCIRFAQTLVPAQHEHSLFFDAPNSQRDQIFEFHEVKNAGPGFRAKCEAIFKDTRAKYLEECKQSEAPSSPIRFHAVNLGFNPPLQSQPDRRRRCNRVLGFRLPNEQYTWERIDKWLKKQKNSQGQVDGKILEMIYELPMEENIAVDQRKTEPSLDAMSGLDEGEVFMVRTWAKDPILPQLLEASEQNDVESSQYKAWLTDFSSKLTVLLIPSRLWKNDLLRFALILQTRRKGHNKVANKSHYIIEYYRFRYGQVVDDALLDRQMLRGEGDHSHFKRDRYMKLRCWAEYLRYPDMDSFALLGNKGFLAWLDYVAVEEKITDDQVDSVYMTDPPGWPQPDD